MLKKSFCVVFIGLAVVVFFNSTVFAADSTDLKVVFRKAKSAGGALNRGDKEVIEKYVSNSMDELANSLEFTEMLDIRNEIVSFSIKKKPSEYSMAFANAIEKAFGPALVKVENTSDQILKNQLAINLLILLADIEIMDLAPIGISMFGDENAAIKYWAVSSVANSEVATQLKAAVTGNPKLAAKIVSAFDKMVDNNTLPDILNLIVGFADVLDSSEADAILVRIADIRIDSYIKWTVKYELMDAGLLNSLARTIRSKKLSAGTSKTKVARRFAQLYSCVIQRYILGFNTLADTRKAQLSIVLGDVEKTSVGKLTGQSQIEIKQLLSSNNQRTLDLLDKEHDSLLGSASGPGRLAQKLNFDYGKFAGKKINAPKRISAPKQEVGIEVK